MFFIRVRLFALLVLLIGAFQNNCQAEERALQILVMDPLAAPLSCNCVEGHGQRKYDYWAAKLKVLLDREIKLTFNDNIGLAQKQVGKQFDLVIGKAAIVQFDLAREKLKYVPLAKLTNKRGATSIRGLIVVRSDSKIKTVADLVNNTIAIGPVEDSETHQAALDLFKEESVFERIKTVTAGSIDSAVFALTDKEVDAAVISDFMPSLLEGCGKVAPGALRIIGQTVHRRFVEIFVPSKMKPHQKQKLLNAIATLNKNPQLSKLMETRWGFVPHQAPDSTWTYWRGKKQDGHCNYLPKMIPDKMNLRWQSQVTGPAMAGIAVTEQFLVVADKDKQLTTDIMRCLNAKTGQTVWEYRYKADKQIDFTNSPRAMPVICDGLVYTQGAMGDLCCLHLASGQLIWGKHLVHDFAGEQPLWGYSSPVLIDGDRIIVAPGGKEAAVVCLDRFTSKTIWKTPGHATAYSAYQIVSVNNRRQLIGYDVAGLVGWQPESGKRLWDLIPPANSDFNVTTPLFHQKNVILATENNATRLYRLNDLVKGKKEPLVTNEDCAPDTCSPVIWKDRLFCAAYGELFCLDMKDGMKVLWSESGDEFYDHVHLIAGDDRVLLWSTSGDLILFDALADEYKPISNVRPFGERKVETMSHPALTRDFIYLRDAEELKCIAW